MRSGTSEPQHAASSWVHSARSGAHGTRADRHTGASALLAGQLSVRSGSDELTASERLPAASVVNASNQLPRQSRGARPNEDNDIMATKPNRNGLNLTGTPPGDNSGPSERPEQWGWHHEWGRAARAAGWIAAGLLLAMHTTVQYGLAGRAWLTAFALAIVAGLIRDAHHRKNAWRNRSGEA